MNSRAYLMLGLHVAPFTMTRARRGPVLRRIEAGRVPNQGRASIGRIESTSFEVPAVFPVWRGPFPALLRRGSGGGSLIATRSVNYPRHLATGRGEHLSRFPIPNRVAARSHSSGVSARVGRAAQDVLLFYDLRRKRAFGARQRHATRAAQLRRIHVTLTHSSRPDRGADVFSWRRDVRSNDDNHVNGEQEV